jgi:hypothetical protein
MIIMVTQEDINAGAPSRCADCPVALAAKRAFYPRNVMVSSTQLSVWNESRKAYDLLYLPLEAQRFVRHFDGNAPVWPFSFSVEASV